jgi:hypothetical protein
MGVKYNLNSILINKKNIYNNINKSFIKLLENDFYITPHDQVKPDTWECKWYNDDTI